MKQFNLIWKESGRVSVGSPRSLKALAERMAAYVSVVDLDRLEIGDTFVDRHGDTWERIA